MGRASASEKTWCRVKRRRKKKQRKGGGGDKTEKGGGGGQKRGVHRDALRIGGGRAVSIKAGATVLCKQ